MADTEKIRAHWEAAHGRREPAAQSWWQEDPTLSRRLVARLAAKTDPVLDVGGGASPLAALLVADGWTRVGVLDVSRTALDLARERAGDAAEAIDWIVADVRDWWPPEPVGLWHDRAVFHFLTDPADRADYVATMDAALREGGHAIIVTFDEDGPETCSGLPVHRWSEAALAAEIARLAPGRFDPLGSEREVHVTPAGVRQPFRAHLFRATGDHGAAG